MLLLLELSVTFGIVAFMLGIPPSLAAAASENPNMANVVAVDVMALFFVLDRMLLLVTTASLVEGVIRCFECDTSIRRSNGRGAALTCSNQNIQYTFRLQTEITCLPFYSVEPLVFNQATWMIQ